MPATSSGNSCPQLGDGRAILLGEVVDRDGIRRDIQLKGSGPTPFSRRGDGRAALGPVLREYIVSEAMFALGIPTTRSLAAVVTGEHVIRETALPGAVLTRVASSHIRVGTFQFFAVRRDTDAVRRLADHVIARHYPELLGAERPYHALLAGVVARQAELDRTLAAGRLHPRRDEHRQHARSPARPSITARAPSWTPTIRRRCFRSIDEMGRYAYANQPRIALWNLTRLAECLLPLFADDQEKAVAEAQDILGAFSDTFSNAYQAGLRKKIGLFTERDGDEALIQDLLDAMAKNQADFTLTFRKLGDAAGDPAADDARAQFMDPAAFDDWARRWRERTALEPQGAAERQAAMHAVNPMFIPRNHRIEAVIQAAVNDDDYAPFEELVKVLAKPFEDQPDYAAYADPPLPDQRVLQTFCGT